MVKQFLSVLEVDFKNILFGNYYAWEIISLEIILLKIEWCNLIQTPKTSFSYLNV